MFGKGEPPADSRRGSFARQSGSEVTLSAEEQADRVLVLQLIRSDGLCYTRQDGSWRNRSNELLVEMGPGNVGREGQVLDRRPTVDETELGNIEVRVASAGGEIHAGKPCEGGADEAGSGCFIVDRSVSTVKRRAPVGIPVVVERATHTPSPNR